MATAYTPDTEHGDDNFILELNRVKEKVRTRFIKLRECLSERESELRESWMKFCLLMSVIKEKLRR